MWAAAARDILSINIQRTSCRRGCSCGPSSPEALSQTGYATPVNQLLLDDPNANWIKYTNEKIGEGYTEPFIYKKSEAYSHVNEFLSKIGIAAQDSVYQDMSTLYCLVTDNCSTREGVQEYLTSYANRIRQSIESGLK